MFGWTIIASSALLIFRRFRSKWKCVIYGPIMERRRFQSWNKTKRLGQVETRIVNYRQACLLDLTVSVTRFKSIIFTLGLKREICRNDINIDS